MMKNQIITFLAAILLLVVFQTCNTSTAQAGNLSKFSIICGKDKNGQDDKCDMETSSCIKCHYKSCGVTGLCFLYQKNWWEYRCVPKGTKRANSTTDIFREPEEDCEDTAGRGGRTGDVVKGVGFNVIKWDSVLGYNCVTDNLKVMYHSICYSCVIVDILISAFVKAGAKAYDVSRQLANTILVIATILWLAMYVLKSVSSFSTVEPMKMLQDILFQLFKVFVAFTIVNAGISTIISYTIEPIIGTGTDFGIAILNTVNEKNEEKAKEKAEEKARDEARKIALGKLMLEDQDFRNLLFQIQIENAAGNTEKAKALRDEIYRRLDQEIESGGASK